LMQALNRMTHPVQESSSYSPSSLVAQSFTLTPARTNSATKFQKRSKISVLVVDSTLSTTSTTSLLASASHEQTPLLRFTFA
jgi:hypothetical protein